MTDFDLLVTVVGDIRGTMVAESDDGAEPSIAAILKEVSKDPDFQGVKLSQAQVRATHCHCPFSLKLNACAATHPADQEGAPRLHQEIASRN